MAIDIIRYIRDEIEKIESDKNPRYPIGLESYCTGKTDGRLIALKEILEKFFLGPEF